MTRHIYRDQLILPTTHPGAGRWYWAGNVHSRDRYPEHTAKQADSLAAMRKVIDRWFDTLDRVVDRAGKELNSIRTTPKA